VPKTFLSQPVHFNFLELFTLILLPGYMHYLWKSSFCRARVPNCLTVTVISEQNVFRALAMCFRPKYNESPFQSHTLQLSKLWLCSWIINLLTEYNFHAHWPSIGRTSDITVCQFFISL
jgi:hypothetical protein